MAGLAGKQSHHSGRLKHRAGLPDSAPSRNVVPFSGFERLYDETMWAPLRLALSVAICFSLTAQVIEFEQNGLRYKTLTKNGVTIMFAPLPSHVREYSIVQVAVSNGSKIAWTVKPEDFTYQRDDGSIAEASPALKVVNSLIEKASRHDVIKLVSTYEAGLYGNSRVQ